MAAKSPIETEIALQRMVTIYGHRPALSGAAWDIPRCVEPGFDWRATFLGRTLSSLATGARARSDFRLDWHLRHGNWLAARIGGISLPALILRLRNVTGQSVPDLPLPQPRQDAAGDDASWLTSGRVVEEIDADTMLERGVHPIGKIRATVAVLGPEEVVVLRSSFRPQPLIETLRRAGAPVHSSMQGVTHLTWFGRQRK